MIALIFELLVYSSTILNALRVFSTYIINSHIQTKLPSEEGVIIFMAIMTILRLRENE